MGLLNMATKYSESLLGFKYRRQLPNGEWAGGPMYYLQDGLKSKWLAWFFAIIAGVAAMLTGPLAQTNSMAVVVHNQFPRILVVQIGGVIFVLVFLVVIGGIKWIAKFAQALTPLKVLLYVGGAMFVLIAHYSQIPAAFGLIISSAFRPTAILGGTAGWSIAMRYGAARGLYATEAGLGTAAIGYSVAKGKNPVQQGLTGRFGRFHHHVYYLYNDRVGRNCSRPVVDRSEIDCISRVVISNESSARRRIHCDD